MPRRRTRLWLERLETRDTPSAPGTGWRLAFADEFNGGAVDPSKWTTRLAWSGSDGSYRHHNNNYLSYIMDDDATVAGGMLSLTTQRRNVTGPTGRVYNYTEGMVQSSGKFSAAYGYYEIRARLPVGQGPGMWPAFWMLASGWPPEMDIGEWWTSNNRSHQGLAHGPNSSNVTWNDYNTYTPLPSGWHTYAMRWEPGVQTYSIDGVTRHTATGSFVPTQAMYLILNSGIESANPPTAATVFPNSFDVDYVRVWQNAGSGATLLNPEFELNPQGTNWTFNNGGSVVGVEARTGARSMRILAYGGGEQLVTGLTPNATYTFSAFAKLNQAGTSARVGVKNYGGADKWTSTSATTYTETEVTFTTGPTSTSATVYLFKPTETGTGYFDDLELVRVPPKVSAVVANSGATQRSRVTALTVNFDSVVTFAGTVAAAFTVSRVNGGAVGGFTASANTLNGATVVTLTGFTGAETEFGSLADGYFALVVRASQVSAGGQRLDGNADATGGDDYALTGTRLNGLFRLFGDANGDGSVSGSDFGLFRLAFGTSLGNAAYVDYLDYDGNGSVSGTDFGNFRTRFGTSLP